jgi:hypothetical protein
MEGRAFWDIITKTRQVLSETATIDQNQHSQAQALTRILHALPLPEVVAFQWKFSRLFQAANRWDLMRIALLIEGCCGDDGFAEFRWWLISTGETDFHRTLEDPENLAEIAHQSAISQFCFFPEFGLAAQQVYEQRTGRDIPDDPAFRQEEPKGEKFAYEPEEMSRRFPRLWERFGENCP